jgi:hypothetical protein
MMNRIRMAAVDGFLAIRRGGLEIGGVLFGVMEPDRVRIEAFRLIECEHARGPSFVLSDADRTRLAGMLVAASEERELAGLALVGWFRSRTRSEISLSRADIELCDAYFPEMRQVVLVLRPEITRPTRAGFFFREEGGARRVDSSYCEFELDAGAPESDATAPESEASAPAAVPPMELKFLEAATGPRAYLRPLWIVALCLSAAAASVAGREYLAIRDAPQTPPLLLDVSGRDGELHITWDRSAPMLRQARGGRIEIVEGGTPVSADLEPAQLQSGSFHYLRRTERVDIHLTVLRKSGGPVGEYAIYYGPAPERREQ